MEQYSPSERLKPFVKTFMFIEAEEATNNFVLPDTSLVLALRYDGKVTIEENGKESCLPANVFSGLRKSSRIIKYSRKTANLLIIFEPGGAAAFFKEPLNELFGESLSAGYFKGYSDLDLICERLSELKNNQQRVTLIEDVLCSKLKWTDTDVVVSLAIQKINQAKGNINIKDLTKELCLSLDAFEKRFRQSVGTTPKQFSSIIRLRNAIDNHRLHKNLTQTAFEAGYFDQAHFINDFKLFTGKTPGQFFKKQSFW